MIVLAAIEREVLGRRGLRRPIDQQIPGVGCARTGVGVEQPDDWRFEPLGAVDGQNPHATRVGARRLDGAFVGRFIGIGVAQFAQLVDEARQARVAPAIDVEREQQELVQIGLDAGG